MQSHPRLDVLDLCRATGLAYVLFRHVLGIYSPPLQTALAPQDATILDFFFLMSGFFAGYSYEFRMGMGGASVAELLFDRASRLYPMAILGTLITFVWVAAHLIHHRQSEMLGQAINAYVFGSLLIPAHISLASMGVQNLFPFDVPLWFIFYDFISFFFFIFILRFLPITALIVLVATSGAGLWYEALTHNGLMFSTYWWGMIPTVPRVTFDVTLGYLIFRCPRSAFRPSRLWGFVPILLLIAVVFLPLPAASHWSGFAQALVSSLVMPVVLFIGIGAKAPAFLSPIASFAGRVSMALYALHWPIVRNLADLRWDLHLHGISLFGLLVAECILPIVLAYVATVCVDEPIRLGLRKLYKRANAISWASGVA